MAILSSLSGGYRCGSLGHEALLDTSCILFEQRSPLDGRGQGAPLGPCEALMTSTPDTSVAESRWERYAVTLIEAHYPCPPDRLARQQSPVRAGASFLIPDATVYDGVEHLRTHGRVQCPKCGAVLHG